jgi:FkbM family methyltransferase
MSVISHAQSGEDLHLAHLVEDMRNTSYIDVGCLWPREHSNSYFFYERGGSGLCIDANPTVEGDFVSLRPRDVFLNCGIGEEPGELTYHFFRNPVFNTFSPDIAAKRQAEAARNAVSHPNGRTLVKKESIPVITLDTAIERAKPNFLDRDQIDFLSIDIEGFELAALRGFSFRPRPRVIVIEDLSRRTEPAEVMKLVISKHLVHQGYAITGFLGHNLYFGDAS